MFGQRLGLELTHVPYRGTAANLTGLLRGDVLFCIDNLPLYTSYVQAGTVRLLAVSQATRSSLVPDVPTLQEAGLAGFDVASWFGISAATGTPQPIIARFSAEVTSAVLLPDVASRFRAVGAEPAPQDSAQYAAFIAAEIEKWAPLVRLSGESID
jgi:tripartite-type tricarboxylate transporter receptor subunit TctC